MADVAIPITGDVDADRLLEDDPLALLLGMMLDQQVPMEWAFRGPYTLRERLDGPLDATEIAAMDPRHAGADVSREAGPSPLPGVDGEACTRSVHLDRRQLRR